MGTHTEISKSFEYVSKYFSFIESQTSWLSLGTSDWFGERGRVTLFEVTSEPSNHANNRLKNHSNVNRQNSKKTRLTRFMTSDYLLRDMSRLNNVSNTDVIKYWHWFLDKHVLCIGKAINRKSKALLWMRTLSSWKQEHSPLTWDTKNNISTLFHLLLMIYIRATNTYYCVYVVTHQKYLFTHRHMFIEMR